VVASGVFLVTSFVGFRKFVPRCVPGLCVGISAGAVPSCRSFVIRRVAAFESGGPSVVFACGSIVRCCRAVVRFRVTLGRSTDITFGRALCCGELFAPTGDLFNSLTARR
jgi:hypothetical protein